MAARRKKATGSKARRATRGGSAGKKSESGLVPFGGDHTPAIPDDLRERFGKYVERDAASTVAAVGNQISTKGGTFTFNGEDIGRELSIVPLGAIHLNILYHGNYNPDQPGGAACFAINHDQLQLAPPPTLDLAEEQGEIGRQSDSCKTCWANAFGSNPRTGKGKACNNRIRLVVMSMPEDFGDFTAEYVQQASLAFINIPTMSRDNWSTFANKIVKGYGVPVFFAPCEMTVRPHDKYLFEVDFEELGLIETVDIIDALEARMEEVEAVLVAPPALGGQEEEDEEEDKPKPKKGGGGRRPPQKKAARKKAGRKKATRKTF